jgi:hypothetical protein
MAPSVENLKGQADSVTSAYRFEHRDRVNAMLKAVAQFESIVVSSPVAILYRYAIDDVMALTCILQLATSLEAIMRLPKARGKAVRATLVPPTVALRVIND